MTSARRIPALDGLRAISIVFVLLSHLGEQRDLGWIQHDLERFTRPLGELGVRVFFVISGFLITSLLIGERERTGGISLREFYVRRAIRILPAVYAFLGAMFVASRLGWLSLPASDLVHALTFTTNYHPVRAWTAGHIWSLSVEEQFYLLWPALVVILGARRSLRAALAFVVLCPLLRVSLFALVPAYRPLVGESFETVGDAIATGCLLAGARTWLATQPTYGRFLRSPIFVVVPLLVFATNALSEHARFTFAIGTTSINVGIALIVDRATRFSESTLTRVLDHPALRFIGVRSYSLYLWQQPFLDHTLETTATRFPLNLALTCLAAFVSYGAIEQPMLKLRARFAR